MGRQLNIRSDRAYELAAQLAEREGKSIARIVEQALEAYQAAQDREKEERLERWKKLLEQDRKHVVDREFTVEDLYDPETGLPA